MKKFTSVMLSCLFTASLFTGCASKPTDAGKPAEKVETKPIVLRLADVHPEGYPTVLGDREFARLVEERTQGRIKVEVYSGGQLGDEKSVTEQIQFGAIDLARLSLSPITEFEKSLGALMLPYLYRDKEHMFKVVDGPIGDKLLKKLEESKLVGLCWFDAGARNFYNSKKEVKSPADMKGLKIRVQETKLMMDLVSSLGASPVAMAYGDVYSALQTGVIDGAENNWPSYESTHHFEVAKFITVDEHTRIPELILMSKMSLDKIAAADQKIIKEAAREAALFERQEWLKGEEKAQKAVTEKGVKITKLETNKEFQDKVMGIYNEFGKDYKDLIEEIINTK